MRMVDREREIIVECFLFRAFSKIIERKRRLRTSIDAGLSKKSTSLANSWKKIIRTIGTPHFVERNLIIAMRSIFTNDGNHRFVQKKNS